MSNPTQIRSDFDNALQTLSLDRHNTLGLACRAKRVLTLSSLAQLPHITALSRDHHDLFVLGGGSNVVLPAQLDRVVVQVALKGIALVEAGAPGHDSVYRIDVAAGEGWHHWVETATQRGWFGLENLALIPGTVGGSPVQNIGAYGVEVQDRIESVTAWHIPEGRLVTLSRTECAFTYRDSIFKRADPGTWLIVSVRFLLPKQWVPVLNYPDLQKHPMLAGMTADTVTGQQILDAVCEIRRTKLPDPAILGNAGSFFKNPIVPASQYVSLKQKFSDLVAYAQPDGSYKLAAGWMIERSGWKGKRQGSVGVHDRQALVLVNYGGAQVSALLGLAQDVRSAVLAQFGVPLEMEPVVVSDSPSAS
ncbi:MAG: UDP-N-acetylmuramate dehydrogenase [Burkholderiaceae bacterium]|nr:UDP-N-acetylmuramate dehydrogenase [Burkholderiaceae bacterium]